MLGETTKQNVKQIVRKRALFETETQITNEICVVYERHFFLNCSIFSPTTAVWSFFPLVFSQFTWHVSCRFNAHHGKYVWAICWARCFFSFALTNIQELPSSFQPWFEFGFGCYCFFIAIFTYGIGYLNGLLLLLLLSSVTSFFRQHFSVRSLLCQPTQHGSSQINGKRLVLEEKKSLISCLVQSLIYA